MRLLSSKEQLIIRRCNQTSSYYLYGENKFYAQQLAKINPKLIEESDCDFISTDLLYYERCDENEKRSKLTERALEYPNGFRSMLRFNNTKWCTLIGAFLYTLATECLEYKEGMLSNLYEYYIAEITPTNRPDKGLEHWFKTGVLELVKLIQEDLKELKEDLYKDEKIVILDVAYTSEIDIKVVYKII